MHKAVVIVPVLAWTGIAAAVPYSHFWPDFRGSQGTVVVVQSRPAEEAARPAPAEPPPAPRVIPAAGDRTALIRELQKELKRVGCYEGDISGSWTTSSRSAMRAFTDRVNAKLPIDQPDQILLRLVQTHRQRACGAPCPPGQQDDSDGRCVPSAIASQAARKPSSVASEESPVEQSAIITSSTVTTGALGAAMPPPERNPSPLVRDAPQPERSAVPPAVKLAAQPSPVANEPDAARSARRHGFSPRLGIYERRRRYGARRTKSRPPAMVRSLVRSVQRAIGSFGF